MTNKVFTIVRKDGKINATVEAKATTLDMDRSMDYSLILERLFL